MRNSKPTKSAHEIGDRSNRLRVAFSWNGLPQYAARQLRAAVDVIGSPCTILGSPPSVPIEGMEDALGQPIIWIDERLSTTWAALGLEVPDVFFQSGWGYKGFNALGREVRERGGVVIGFSDANFRSNFRQLVLGGIWFRLNHRRRFDAMIVPGKSGVRLMKYFGMPEDRIFEGMLGADHDLFKVGLPLAERPKRFLFVGQFIARKDVVGLSRAFARFRLEHPDWELLLLGGGEQHGEIIRGDGITVGPFVQPQELGAIFRDARFFVLPSREEAWGLVVHEAALSGCGLVLSDKIGSSDDLAEGNTQLRFRAGDENDMLRALRMAAAMKPAALEKLQMSSLASAQCFGPARFANAVIGAVKRVTTWDL